MSRNEEAMNTATEIQIQARDVLLKPNTQLQHAVRNTIQQGLPPIAVSPLHGQYLALQCQLIGAKSVLEIGTLAGYSSIWLASTGAKVTSIEFNPKHRDIALENTKGLDVDIILGSALDILPKLASEGRQFDFVFIDANWDEQEQYFDWAVKLTRPNGCIYVDNVVRAMGEEWDGGKKENLLTKVGKDERVSSTLITTFSNHKEVRSENLDGFILAVVKAK